ncbi:uncharacterized protein LOC105156490 isoform X2 [Sesamum indicum]|uniref:Uncharacterized protein LOC105156490 isoform X2 n=1 Tax=Sesamum indicum TaxID=4182 RepID=A0A6I9SUD8_SESIN|nr:uncharacterized protein LOC105156490 isoform X2 [Sesamum indicum]
MDGENRKQSKTNGNVSNDWGETFKTLNSPSISESDSGSETKLEEIERSSSKISESSDIVSSSSSNSSSADFFPVNPKELPKSRVSIDIPKPNEVTKQLYESGKTDVSIKGWHGLEESARDSQESNFSDVTHESFQPHILPTQSPPVQMMERPGSFDPHKIPASIFNRQPSLNWSTESNESLFSISIGNLSFSRDALRMSTDMYRTGELPKRGELFKSREMPLSRELHRSGESHNCRKVKFADLNKTVGSTSFKETLPAAEGVEPNEKTDTSKNISEHMKPGVKGVIDKPSSDVPEACVNAQSDTNVDESSKISNQSSANPIRSYCHLKCPTWSTCCECCMCPSLCCSCACCYCWRPRPHCDNCEPFYTGATVEPSKNVTAPIYSMDAPLCPARSQVQTVA